MNKELRELHKTHKLVERPVCISGDVSGLISTLEDLSEDMINASVTDTSWGGDPSYVVEGWVPKTDKELERDKELARKQRAQKKAARLQKEQDDIALLKKLKEKYPNV
jgi:hypothetical protein